jgi:hypothetical protein
MILYGESKVEKSLSLRWLHQKATSQQHHVEVHARGCWIPWDALDVPGDPGLHWKTGRFEVVVVVGVEVVAS